MVGKEKEIIFFIALKIFLSIDGILRTQGGANFFLVNPNGIVFGENAQLDVGGSFVATTANSVQFSDGAEFAALGTDLTVSVPIGLQFDGDSGAIEVDGIGNEVTIDSPVSPTILESSQQGLEVESGNTLALIGKNIAIDGGTVKAPEGSLELSSVGQGVVEIQSTQSGLTFDYSNVDTYQNIDFTNQAALTSGAITVTGGNVSFKDGSIAIIPNQRTSDSGDININATEALTLSGTSGDETTSSSIRAQALDSGAGGDVNISTGELVLQDNSTIAAITFSDGQGGNINIDADNSIEILENTVGNLNGTNAGSPVSTIVSITYGLADAGNLQVSTPRLKIIDGNSIGSPSVGTGSGGNVSINADSIDLIGAKETGS